MILHKWKFFSKFSQTNMNHSALRLVNENDDGGLVDDENN